MAQKAMLFDSSRCTGCQACAAACGRVRGVALPAAGEDGMTLADSYQRSSDLDGDAVLAVTFHERVVEPHGLVWEIGRKSCVHCAAAPCAEVCPTGALVRDEETGLVSVNEGRCVGCHLCALGCPADVLRHGSERGSVVKCDGCPGRVRADMPPFCVEACPLDALVWGEREDVIAQANERVAQLRERGFEKACVLGIDEQGGHGVIQVLKYGAAGGAHEALASTGETPWIGVSKMAGPVSVGVLGAAGAAAVAALAMETSKERRAREAARGVPVAIIPGLAPRDDGGWTSTADEGCASCEQALVDYADDDVVEDDAYLDGDFTDEDAAREAEARKAREAAQREAAEREAAMLPRIVAATPAAAAAATAVERHLYPVAFDDDDLCDNEAAALPEVDELGDTGEIPVIGEFEDTGEIPLIDALSDTGEIPVVRELDEEDNGPSVDEQGDTGELYNLADFQRLLAADIVAHHLAKEAAASSEVEGDEGSATDAADAAEKFDADEAVDTTETPADE